ncbi:hypothetical protein GCM10025868_39980 [Angustibacter aerolatus]|uniref:Aldehyde dehydrogenase domain-containing protein n=1 Tax=Angustibacter aerolatus TaxID=1162965 RepID=A0ABQ6JL68_9ACTN|nr:aldehyde dehydrogenase family protein [Angustibacter aerolatus]GMA88748.1 hypothetical protein GCM10025868_39980 [Angustibacter aerolatus]
MSLALEAGLPEGVLTVLPGRGDVVGERFVTHPLVRKVCFTGSTAVGQRIMRGAAEQVKRVTLEPGWQERQRGVRGRRPRARGGVGARVGVRQRRAGLLRAQPDPGAAQRARPVPRACSSPRCRASCAPTRPTRPPRWGR